MNISLRTGGGETDIAGMLTREWGGPTVLLRAGVDGLPIRGQSESEYRPLHPSIMYACGHDKHIAIGLIVAKRSLLACLLVEEYLRLDYRGLEDLLAGAAELRAALGLAFDVPLIHASSNDPPSC
jgi:hypothetical protein